MSKTDYSACYDLPNTVRGDTLDAFRVTVETVTAIESAQFVLCRTATGDKTVMDSKIEGNSVVLHEIDTSKLYAGLYTYTIKFTINGRERTYLSGKLNIVERCRVC